MTIQSNWLEWGISCPRSDPTHAQPDRLRPAAAAAKVEVDPGKRQDSLEHAKMEWMENVADSTPTASADKTMVGGHDHEVVSENHSYTVTLRFDFQGELLTSDAGRPS